MDRVVKELRTNVCFWPFPAVEESSRSGLIKKTAARHGPAAASRGYRDQISSCWPSRSTRLA